MIGTRHMVLAGVAGGVVGLAGLWLGGGFKPGGAVGPAPASGSAAALPAGALILMTGDCPAGFTAAGTGQVLVSPDYSPVEGQYQGRPGISNAHNSDWMTTDFQLCRAGG